MLLGKQSKSTSPHHTHITSEIKENRCKSRTKVNKKRMVLERLDPSIHQEVSNKGPKKSHQNKQERKRDFLIGEELQGGTRAGGGEGEGEKERRHLWRLLERPCA
jgi:hypothetical protein